jgi:hypothetical protein
MYCYISKQWPPLGLNLCCGCHACSWSPNWGINGTVRIAYGSAYIMQNDYTFALSHGPADASGVAAEITSRLQAGLSRDNTTPSCVSYSAGFNTRLIKLVKDAVTLSALSLGDVPDASTIMLDVVSSNLGLSQPLHAARKGPLRVCGVTGAWLSTVMDARPSPSPSPASPGPTPAASPSPATGVQ